MRWLIILVLILGGILIYGYTRYNRQYVYTTKFAESIQTEVVTASTPTPMAENWAYASWYDRGTCGNRIYGQTCRMANGEVFDEQAFTVACAKRFRLGDRIRFTYKEKVKEAVCTDRGGFERFNQGQRLFDFSKGLFQYFERPEKGIIKVKYEIKNERR